MRYLTMGAAAVLMLVPQIVNAQNVKAATPEAMKHVSSGGLQWAPIQPEGFAPGMEIAVLSGDPAVADQPYTIRLHLKDGYRFPAHYHPKTENLTVLRGTFLLKMGDTASESLDSYAPGDYLYLPPLQPHYGGAKGETVIQLHGTGPFEIKLAKPASK